MTAALPRTAVLFQWVGMGDLVWHAPYFRRVAETSRDGQITLIASPTTFAQQLLGHEPWLRGIIDFDRHPRRHEGRQGRHRGVLGLFRMGRELRPLGFERIVLFTNHSNRTLVAVVAGIPERLGYGTSWFQRLLLTRGPWITRYKGPAVGTYEDATSFAIGHFSKPHSRYRECSCLRQRDARHVGRLDVGQPRGHEVVQRLRVAIQQRTRAQHDPGRRADSRSDLHAAGVVAQAGLHE